MSFVQRLITSLVPSRIAGEIETESRAWKMTCSECSSTQSVWDAGGIRWKAKGSPRTRSRCASCAKVTWHGLAKG